MKNILLFAIILISVFSFTTYAQESEQKTVTSTLNNSREDNVEELNSLLNEFQLEIEKSIVKLEESTNPQATQLAAGLKQQITQIDQVKNQFVNQRWPEISAEIRKSMERSGMSEDEIEGQLLTFKTEWETGISEAIKDIKESISELKETVDEMK